jgi:drug/metabolite transporter (DMT)-like permease
LVKKPDAGVLAALSSAFFLGLSPIFGKLAILQGYSPLLTVSLRTGLAALAMLVIFLVFYRSYFYIFPIGLVGCAIAGIINGFGSILYYLALGKLDVTIGQLLYSLYPFFVAVWLILDHQPPSKLTFVRTGLAFGAVILLTRIPNSFEDPIGVLMMIGAAVLYALHLPINQRVLYEVPAPTVTLYTLVFMSLVVVPAYFLFDRTLPLGNPSLTPIILMTSVTFFSRLLLFLGVKKIGGMQTALFGLLELFITIFFGYIWLRENLSIVQWIGAFILSCSLLMIYFEKPGVHISANIKTGWLAWLRSPELPKGIFRPYE